MPTRNLAAEVVENLLEGCQVIGPDFRYLFVNAIAATQGQSTPERLLGRTMMECYPGIEGTAMFSVLSRVMRERQHARMENEFTLPDGTLGYFELRFVPVPAGVCILSLEITEQRRVAERLARTEAQLRQAQKMEAVGRLAGGVAHDFNNLLSVVLSYADLALESVGPGADGHVELKEIRAAGERGAALTRQLLTFSRQRVVAPEVVDLARAIGPTLAMIRRIVGDHIEVRSAVAPDVGRVRLDRSQIDQVLLNLVVNARDAMPSGGVLTIEVQAVEFDEAHAAAHLGVKPGRFAMLAVSDTGNGMDRATQERIFEPFFTTKPAGQGTGLGLATVFGIARQCGGSAWVYSELGRGTTFKVYLPSTDAAPVSSPSLPTLDSSRGGETVLLVEDQAPVRVAAREILVRAGYRVMEAPSGEEALALAAAFAGRIELLLTDVIMPRMSGRELAERLTTARPDLRVLYMSGFTGDAMVSQQLMSPGVPILQKPITRDELLRRVRAALSTELV